MSLSWFLFRLEGKRRNFCAFHWGLRTSKLPHSSLAARAKWNKWRLGLSWKHLSIRDYIRAAPGKKLNWISGRVNTEIAGAAWWKNNNQHKFISWVRIDDDDGGYQTRNSHSADDYEMEICRERTKTSFHCSHCRRWALSSELIYSFSTNRSFSSSVSLWIRENLRDNSTPIVSLLLRGGLKVFFVHTVFICLKKLLCFSFRFAHSRNISSTCKSFLRAGSRCGEGGQMCTEEKFIIAGKKNWLKSVD